MFWKEKLTLLTFASIKIWILMEPGPVYLFDRMSIRGAFGFLQNKINRFSPSPFLLSSNYSDRLSNVCRRRDSIMLTSLDSNWLHNTDPILFPWDENSHNNQTEYRSTNTHPTFVCNCFAPNWHNRKNWIVGNFPHRHHPPNIREQYDKIRRGNRQFRWVLPPM